MLQSKIEIVSKSELHFKEMGVPSEGVLELAISTIISDEGPEDYVILQYINGDLPPVEVCGVGDLYSLVNSDAGAQLPLLLNITSGLFSARRVPYLKGESTRHTNQVSSHLVASFLLNEYQEGRLNLELLPKNKVKLQSVHTLKLIPALIGLHTAEDETGIGARRLKREMAFNIVCALYPLSLSDGDTVKAHLSNLDEKSQLIAYIILNSFATNADKDKDDGQSTDVTQYVLNSIKAVGVNLTLTDKERAELEDYRSQE